LQRCTQSRLKGAISAVSPAPDDRVLLANFTAAGCNIASPGGKRVATQLGGARPQKRANLILAYVDGCAHREIAAQLGVPIGTAKVWIGHSPTALPAGLD